jgi:hypothetical protein
VALARFRAQGSFFFSRQHYISIKLKKQLEQNDACNFPGSLRNPCRGIDRQLCNGGSRRLD